MLGEGDRAEYFLINDNVLCKGFLDCSSSNKSKNVTSGNLIRMLPSTCGEGELVSTVHTLVAGVVQVYHRLHAVEEVEREDQSEETAHTWMVHGDDMKDSNLSQGACVCEDEDTTTYLRECARRSVDVVAGVRIVKCHASIDVVMDVRIVMLCHPLISFFHFSEFSLRAQILILLSCCNNSS